MATTRRFGAVSSATRSALLDAVEAVMRDDGYGALTARSVAEKAGLKHQLVYYYFQTLDDLLIAAYERHIASYLERIEEALTTDAPLHAFWRVHANPPDATLNMEFLSMANHIPGIRARTIEFGEHVRRLGLGKMEGLIVRPALGMEAVTPFAVTMAITSIGSIMGLENAIGLSGGHAEMRAMMEWCIDQLEPGGSFAPDAATGSGSTDPMPRGG